MVAATLDQAATPVAIKTRMGGTVYDLKLKATSAKWQKLDIPVVEICVLRRDEATGGMTDDSA